MATIEGHIKEKRRVALSSVIASFFLTMGKLVVGFLTGSLGIISEAAHSALDFGAALITYFAVRVSDKPADERHHYGHAKIENFSALIESILLFITCAWIIKEAVSRLLFKEVPVEINIWSFTILIISIAVDFSRSRALSRAAKKFNSQALEADALHFTSDIFSSLVVIAGLFFTKYGLAYADSLAALTVAVIVIFASLKLARRTVDVLLDKAPQGLDERIAGEVMEIPGVVGVHKVRLRQAGGRIHGDLHVVMDRNISFVDGHKIASVVEEKLSKHGDDIVLHFEPEENWEEVRAKIEETKNKVKKIMRKKFSLIKDYHDLEVNRGPNGTSINIHIVVPKGSSVQEARRCCDNLETEIKKELREASVHFNIEPCEGACQACEERCEDDDN